MSKVNLKKIAAEVLDAYSLREHDMRYHDGHYRGGKCKFRENYEKPDRLDSDLEEANALEAKIYSGRRYEKTLIEDAFTDEFHIDQKKGMHRMFLEPDSNGENQMFVEVGENVPDSLIDEAKVKKFFKDRGYQYRGMTIDIKKGKSARSKPKKQFKIDVYKPEQFELANENDKDAFTIIAPEVGELNDDEASKGLKQFGYKKENGQIKKRTADDSRADRARKYLGIVGDIEGQSNREDVESGIWEKRRLASLKRAKEERERERLEAENDVLKDLLDNIKI